MECRACHVRRHGRAAWPSNAGAAFCLTGAWSIGRAPMADERTGEALAVILTP